MYLETCRVGKWVKVKEEGGAQIVVTLALPGKYPPQSCTHSLNIFQVSRYRN
jgi:hypothetical protein